MTVNAAPFIDLTYQYFDWNDWHSNIIHNFGEQNLPFVPDEKNWVEFAKAFASTPYLASYNIQDPSTYEKWQTWVDDLLTTINGVLVGQY